LLLGQSYRTPHGAVIDEYGAMVERWLAGGKSKNSEKNCLVPLCTLQTPRGVTWEVTPASVVTGQRITA
jgi:hypothetical protein